MSSPKRIQRKRTKGWRMPKNTIYVGRPGYFGNPFRIGQTISGWDLGNNFGPIVLDTIDKVILAYRFWLDNSTKGQAIKERVPRLLKGYDLCCWCAEKTYCHADILLELANKQTNEQE